MPCSAASCCRFVLAALLQMASSLDDHQMHWVMAVTSTAQAGFGGYGVVLKQFAQSYNISPVLFSCLRRDPSTCAWIFNGTNNKIQKTGAEQCGTHDSGLDSIYIQIFATVGLIVLQGSAVLSNLAVGRLYC